MGVRRARLPAAAFRPEPRVAGPVGGRAGARSGAGGAGPRVRVRHKEPPRKGGGAGVIRRLARGAGAHPRLAGTFRPMARRRLACFILLWHWPVLGGAILVLEKFMWCYFELNNDSIFHSNTKCFITYTMESNLNDSL